MQFNRFQTLSDIFILIGLVIFGGIVFGMLGMLLCMPIFKLDIAGLQSAISDSGSPANVQVLKLFNLFATFGAWVASSYLFIRLRNYDAGVTWQVKYPKPLNILWALPVVCVALLFISSFLININAALPIPEGIKNLSSSGNEQILENMLRMDNTRQLLINILVIGLAPALFEEIFFRGTLQRLLIHLFGNAHAGVWCTSFVFAAIHLNVMQFIPMFFLALVLGYVCHYSKSIWPSIILHFLNNSSAVVVNYLESRSELAQQLADDRYNPPIILTIISFLLIGLLFYWIINYNKREETLSNE